jgi:hypothetical protein
MEITYSEGMECSICCLTSTEHSWFPLACCKNGVCLPCVCKIHPKACPFCRTPFEHDEDCECRLIWPQREEQRDREEESSPDPLLTEAEEEWAERSFRRTQRRMRRLELREVDRERNTLWIIIRKNCMSGGAMRRSLRRFIRDEVNMLYS